MDIWVVQIKSTLYKRFLYWNKIFKKNKVNTGKTPFDVIVQARRNRGEGAGQIFAKVDLLQIDNDWQWWWKEKK